MNLQSLFIFKPILYSKLFFLLFKPFIKKVHYLILYKEAIKMKARFRFEYLIKHMWLITGILFFISCKSESTKPEEIIMNYGTGEIQRRYTEINHKKEGLMTDYYPGGKLKAERVFKNDIQVGKTTLYYERGKIQEVQYYKDGNLTGGDTVFFENGKPQFLLNFTDGIKDGYVRKWAEDGSIIFEAKYSKDTLVEVKGQAIKPDTMHIEGYSSKKGFRK